MTAPDWQPTLTGALLTLRPMVEGDFAELFRVASDPDIWAQHPAHDRWQEAVFRQYFDDGLAGRGALVAIDRASGRLIGSSRYHGYDAAASEVEIGWTFLARSHWGGRFNREMKQLMVAHALESVSRVIFAVGEDNGRSRAALARIGATLTAERKVTRLRGADVSHVIYELRHPVTP